MILVLLTNSFHVVDMRDNVNHLRTGCSVTEALGSGDHRFFT